ncbi:MAG: hypothetical protein IT317_03465 [Anaerolineales bacterium]|nr:hypothetical protein [Anaerolineales bacterium]
MVLIVRTPVTTPEVTEMLRALGTYIKVAVDIQRGVLAGGVMHVDCETMLLEDGSAQEDIWGADWDPASGQITFEALINIRPRQNNRALVI